ncbi:hypothetical protein GW846_05090 [Candidatus Gracilibacteria bacterium]|nr:hypothetical protein [Candidatus Gracilibacteria bacterium]
MIVGLLGDYEDPFLDGVRSCLEGYDSLSDFTSICSMRLTELGIPHGISIEIDYCLEEDNKFFDTCDRIFEKKYWIIQEKMKRFHNLIHNTEFSQKSDIEFRMLQQDADKVIHRTCALVDRICQSILNNSKIQILPGKNT